MYHSITFGTISNGIISGKNTWDDWHLIPSSRPTVAQAGVSISQMDIPGRKDGPINSTNFLTGTPVYSARSGNFEFYVDNDHEYWETIRMNIANYLGGKKMKMILEDDPDYYYEGRFALNNWQSEANWSIVTISYALEPYKYRITTGEGQL